MKTIDDGKINEKNEKKRDKKNSETLMASKIVCVHLNSIMHSRTKHTKKKEI